MRTGFLFHSLAIVEQTSKKLLPDLLISGWSVVLFWPALPDEQTKTASTARTDRRRIELSNQGRSRHSGGELTLTFRSFNDLRFHSNANKKVIDTQCTSMLFSRVFAATQPRTVLTSLPSACTPPRGPNSPRKAFRINTCKSLSKQTTLTVIESHSYKKHRGWGVLWLTNSRLVVSGHSLCSVFSLFAQRVFHNSSAIKRFHTLSQNCRGVTLQFPIWELFTGHRAERPLFSSLPFNGLRTLPSSVVCKPFACHSYENCRVCTNNSHSGSSRATAKGTQHRDCPGRSPLSFIFHQSPVTSHPSCCP